MNAVLIGFIVYLVLLVVIGLLASRFMRTLNDFLLGGWRAGALVCAISERASGESAWFLLGLPGLAYASGFSAFWTVIGCAIGIFLSWNFIAQKLREKTGEYNALTIPDFLESASGDNTGWVRIVATVIILFFYTLYVSAQFIGAGKILNVSFGIPHLYGMIIGALIVIFYTLMGGFLAVAWTDVLQGLLMAFVSIFLPLIAIIKLGGFSAFISKISYKGADFLTITGGKTGSALIFGLALSGLGVGLGYLGQPHLLTRYMALRDSQLARHGMLIAMLWVLTAYWGAVFIGLSGAGFFPSIPDREKIMPLLAVKVFPAWFAGILISGAIAAMMSTADTQLLVATSAVSEDIYHKLLKKEVSQEKLVFISRIATVIMGVIAFILALTVKEKIFSFVLYAWSGLAASFAPPIILGLYGRLSKCGAVCGMLTGTAVTVVWHNVPVLKSAIYELIPAFILSFVVTYFLSKR